MKYFFIILLSFFAVKAHSQADSLRIDTMFQNQVFLDYFSNESLNSLPIVNKIIEPKQSDFFKQYFFLFMLNLLCVATLLLNFSKLKVKRLFSTLFNINLLKQLAQSESKKENIYLYAFFILFYIFLLVLCFVFNIVFNLNLDLLKIAISIFAFFIIESIINKLTSYIFKAKEVLDSVYFNSISIVLVSIPLIILSILLSVFLPIKLALYASLFSLLLLSFIYLWKEIRNIMILQSFKIKIVSFYFFLYLCTFKILPIAILLNYLSNKL